MIQQIKPILTHKEAQAVFKYMNSGGWLTENNITREFEKQIAERVGSSYCSAVPNGTIGLVLALMACGIQRGDRVAVPALTMVATANAVRFLGAIPVFVDVDTNGCMDIGKLKDRVHAVLFVSLNGRDSTLEDVIDYCERNKIFLIEDACQAFGGRHEGRGLGTLGNVGVFSFSPHKIITTGQGGAVITSCPIMAENIRVLRDFGRVVPGSDEYSHFGINAKFTDLQATVGLVQLEDLDTRIAKKREIYDEYVKHLPDVILSKPDVPWLVDMYSWKRDEIHDRLLSNGVRTRKMYPVIPTNTCYADSGKYPIAEELSRKGLFLPSSLDLTSAEIEEICKIIKECYE